MTKHESSRRDRIKGPRGALARHSTAKSLIQPDHAPNGQFRLGGQPGKPLVNIVTADFVKKGYQPKTGQLSTPYSLRSPRLKIHVRPNRTHPCRPTIPVVARVVQVLHVDRVEQAAPRVPGVVGLDNVLAPVAKRPIAQQKS